jgi:hypothetical protein
MHMREAIANQGEIRIDRIAALPEIEVKPFTDRTRKGWIISHSEQGHHHILAGDCEVMERVDVPTGARILYAIVKEPTRLFQDAAVPHQPVSLDPGIYEFRLKREYDPFAEQVRRVMD